MRRDPIQASNGLPAFGYEKGVKMELSESSIASNLWGISKQHFRQIIRPQPVPSRSEPFNFKTISASSSRARLRREGKEAFGPPEGVGEDIRRGEGLREPVPRELGRGSPVHVRTQMAHVDALHLHRG